MEHYIKSAAVCRNQHLRQALVHSYLGDNTRLRKQLADEIEGLECRLNQRERDPLSDEQIHTCKEMLYARLRFYRDISYTAPAQGEPPQVLELRGQW